VLPATERFDRARALATLHWSASRWRLVAVGGLTVIRGLLPIAMILAIGSLVGAVPGAVAHGFNSSDGTQALWGLVAVAAAFLLEGVSDALGQYAHAALSSRFVIAVHETVVTAAAVPAGIAPLEDPEIAGQLSAVEEFQNSWSFRSAMWSLQGWAVQRIQGIAAFIILLGFRWWAPLLMLAAWRVSLWAILNWVMRGTEISQIESSMGLRRARYFRGLAVDAPAAKEVRVFGLGDWLGQQYTQTWLGSMGELWRVRREGTRRIILAGAVLALAHGVVLGLLGRAAFLGDISPSKLAVFALAVFTTQCLGAAGDYQWGLIQQLQGSQRVMALVARLREFRSPPDASGPTTAGPMTISLTDVRFTYPGRDMPTLDGLRLTIPAGQSVAVVGENGAGKTTLIKLLCGLYDVDSGLIKLDRITDPGQARRKIGVIFQDFVHYQLPLRDNVGFGCLPLTDDAEALGQALNDAGGGDLPPALPAGWDTVLDRSYDNGADLSGGQWQKVALARALMAVQGGAGLLILDEPTANLDIRAEAELFNRFLQLTRNVTTILVSHRLSSVRHADRIVVIADGRVAEDGTHEELLSRGGRYASMYTLQAERFASAVSGLEE
jgi:ATP-binding cassette subfamily B protein